MFVALKLVWIFGVVVSLYNRVYVFLCVLFCTLSVAGNLMFQKFVVLSTPWYGWELSVGVLLYPISFLITDIITDCYGKSYADFVIKVNVLVCVLIACVSYAGSILPATEWSPVDDLMFCRVFGFYGVGTVASLVASFLAQTLDVAIFSWIKKKTGGRYLWLRNNVSTIVAQFLDTSCVLLLLSWFGVVPASRVGSLFVSSFSFKVLAALLDTPFCYLGHYLFNLKIGSLHKSTNNES